MLLQTFAARVRRLLDGLKVNQDTKTALKDVAAEAGVSIATVSRALDPVRAALLRPETVDRVRRIAARQNLQANRFARRLKRGCTDTLCVLMPPSVFGREGNPDFRESAGELFWDTFSAILEAAESRGFDIKLSPIRGMDFPTAVLRTVQQGRADGVLFFGRAGFERALDLARAEGIPAVVATTRDPMAEPVVPEVTVDGRSGVREAVRWLVSRGHRRVGLMAPYPIVATSENVRFQGYFDVVGPPPSSPSEQVVCVPDRMALRRWLETKGKALPFTAVLCANDDLASILITEAEYLGLRVPADLAVVGFDNSTLRCAEGRLSSVAAPRRELGATATRLLIENLLHGVPIPRQTVLPAQFLLRASC